MSRARWLAYGSAVAVIGCSSGSGGGADSAQGKPDATTSNEGSAGQYEDSSTPTRTEVADSDSADVALSEVADSNFPDVALSSDGTVADADAALPIRWEGDGSFYCPPGNYGDASVYCDKATQYCALCLGSPCAWPMGLGSSCRTVDNTEADPSVPVLVKPGACDGGPMRCACLTGCFVTSGYEWTSCQDDDGGGVTVSCYSCYGSPPARLERLVV